MQTLRACFWPSDTAQRGGGGVWYTLYDTIFLEKDLFSSFQIG